MNPLYELRVISLFEGLSDREIDAIARHCSLRTYDRSDLILGEDERTTDVFFILQGTVRMNSFSLTGREVIFTDVSVGSIFGEFSALDGLPRSSRVMALSNCRLARMPAGAFYNVLKMHNSAAIHLAESLVTKLRDMSERVFEVSALAVRERVRRELLRLAALHGQSRTSNITIKPAPTHYELASRIGSHREAVTREFNRLEARQVMKVSRREIFIPDLAALRATDEC